MGRIIVFDGPRASGKSSMAEEMAIQLNELRRPTVAIKKRHYEHGVEEFRNIWEHITLMEHMIELLELDYVIIDRLVLSEYVMSKYYKRTHPLLLHQGCTSTSSYLEEKEALQFVLRPPISLIKWRMDQRTVDHPSANWDMKEQDIEKAWDDAEAAVPFQIRLSGVDYAPDLVSVLIEQYGLETQ